MRTLLPLVQPLNNENFSFVTDDRHPEDLFKEGHIDVNVKIALEMGMDIVTAIKVATINTARFYKLRNIGAIAPRFWADMLVFEDVKNFMPSLVFKKGQLVAKNGKILKSAIETPAVNSEQERLLLNTMNVKPLTGKALQIPAKNNKIRVIQLIPDQIVTKKIIVDSKIENNFVVADPQRDIAKLAVLERHHATGEIGKGFVKGFNLKKGALASTIAHDSHNLCAVGTNDADILVAMQHLIAIGGGQVVVADEKILADLALPYAGLVSDQSLEIVVEKISALKAAVASIGCELHDAFGTLSFLSLSPLPEMRVTNKGLIDVEKFKIVDLCV